MLQACTRVVCWSGVYALDGYVVVMYLLDCNVALWQCDPETYFKGHQVL